MSYRLALLVAAGATALGTASAQDKEGFYAAAGVGYSYGYGGNDFRSDVKGFDGETISTLDAQEFDSRLDVSDGLALYGAIGKYFPRGIRGEFEISHRGVDVTDMDGDSAGFRGFPTGGNGQNVTAGAGGNESGLASRGDNNDIGTLGVSAGMVNVYKDLAFDWLGPFEPYIGAGLGFARVRAELDNVDSQPAVTDAQVQAAAVAGGQRVGYRIFAQNDDFVTAVQALAGVSWALTDNLSVDLGYRFLRTGEYNFDAYINNEVAEVTGEYSVHETTLGLRWDFGVAGAAPVAAAVAAQPQTKTCFDGTVVPMNQPCPTDTEDSLTPAELRTVVYFEFDSAELSSAARSLLQRRANEAQSVDIIEVLVSGNTDTSGSAGYNERLSARRAQVVREALIQYGIPSDKIRIRALGETNLAKPTADGVREPLNRRTEIEFDF